MATELRGNTVIYVICFLLFFTGVDMVGATDYYVRTDGNDDNCNGRYNSGGSSGECAWKTPSHAADTVVAGDTIYLVDGTWYDEHIVFTNSGTEDNPIIMTAYSGRPTLDGVDKTGLGIEIRNKTFINIVGITVEKYDNGIFLSISDNIVLENITARFCEWDGILVGESSYGCIVKNCTVYNNDMHNIAIGCDAYNNTVKNCYSYCEPDLLPTSDYGIVVISGHHNLITNCKVGDLSISEPKSHGGHGVAFVKSTSVDYGSCDNIVENTVVYNWPTGMEARDNSHSNIFRNCTVVNDDPEKGYDGSYIGFYIFNNANNNTIENSIARGFHEACFGIKSNTNNTLLRNCIAEEYNIYGIQISGSNTTAINCVATEWTGNDKGRAFFLLGDSTLRNSIATNSKYGCVATSGNPTITYCDVWNNTNNYYTASPGTGCISENPLFADPANGDFHLQRGSPCIDAGDPSSDYSNEPLPNGGRINMGAYGNTGEAAMSSGGPTTTSTTSTSTTSTAVTTTSTSTTSTSTTSPSSTSTTTSTTSTTITWLCDLPGDYPPCGEVTLGEVINYIILWSEGSADLSDVTKL